MERNSVNAVLYTDSKVALESLKWRDKQGYLITQIIKKLISLEGRKCKIFMSWVKAHQGIVGNKKADSLAKAGTESDGHKVYNKISRSV